VRYLRQQFRGQIARSPKGRVTGARKHISEAAWKADTQRNKMERFGRKP
jgi:hypothetical protein